MIYEDMTYEYILQRMIDRVTSEYPNLDNREGSIVFNALAPAAMELAIMYTEVDNAISESFFSTASREYLLIACEQMGMDTEPFEPNAGVFKGEFNVNVPIGSRWNCDLYNYEVIEYLGETEEFHYYRMLCETVGTAPNIVRGDLTPISDAPYGLQHARVIECLIEGENETPDEEIREQYYNHVNKAATDGNVAQYEKWCSTYEGIGNFKIFPLWNGTGTVKVSILSASNGIATQDLINQFQEFLDPNTTGMGDGVAPIGAFVTVTTATKKEINVSANVVLAQGHVDTTPIDNAIREYLSEISYKKAILSYMTIGAIILSVEGVETISDLRINGESEDIILGNEEIPVLESVDWTVS